MHAGLIALLSLTGGVLGVFALLFTPLYAGSVPVPLGVVVTVLTLPWLVRAAGELDPRPWTAGAPLAAWTVAVLGIGLTGPGGDIMLPPTWQSMLLLLGGLGTGLWSLRSVLYEENGPPMTVHERERSPRG
ncbi:MAG: hypothetical protein L0H84_11095 [Pseudonocardia sp.]|nr:hypothetical protein [Pseudonocardia sp.]